MLRPCPPARTGISGLRAEIGKKIGKHGFRPRKIGKNWPKNWKMPPKPYFRAIATKTLFLSNFPIFRQIFSYFLEAEIRVFPIFSYFGLEARNPRSSRRAGSQAERTKITLCVLTSVYHGRKIIVMIANASRMLLAQINFHIQLPKSQPSITVIGDSLRIAVAISTACNTAKTHLGNVNVFSL